MKCPLKPGTTCSASRAMQIETPCPGCPEDGGNARFRRFRSRIAERRSTYTVATVAVEQVESGELAPFNHTVENSAVEVERVERPSQMPDSTFLLNLRSTQRVESTGVSPLTTGGEA